MDWRFSSNLTRKCRMCCTITNMAVKHVVVDSGGFIRNASLKDIGENIYTLRDVVSEIRDKATRQRLQVLPYELKYKDPSPEAIRTVTEFAKKTGDYRSLSAVDIRVLAVVYQLEKEHVGTQHLKETPDRNVSWETAKKPLQNPTEIAGFYLSKKAKGENLKVDVKDPADADLTEGVNDLDVGKTENISTDSDVKDTQNESSTDIIIQLTETHGPSSGVVDKSDGTDYSPVTDSSDKSTSSENNSVTNISKTDSAVDTVMVGDTECVGVGDRTRAGGESEGLKRLGEGDVLPEECLGVEGDVGFEEGEDEFEEGDDGFEEGASEGSDAEDEDGGGWITPSNIKQVKASIGNVNTQKADVVVGCITTDFSIQNVLLQMGLNVVSIDGMLIKRAKTYVLRCFACFKVSTDMTRQFCFHCGNQTLKKCSMTVEEDGSIKYFLSTRKPLSTRGMRYSLPAPQGGKHAVNPILVEDQKEAQQRGSRHSKVKYDVFDPDYSTHTSPFAPTDINSRAGQLGIRGNRGRGKKGRNPNENNKVYGRRK